MISPVRDANWVSILIEKAADGLAAFDEKEKLMRLNFSFTQLLLTLFIFTAFLASCGADSESQLDSDPYVKLKRSVERIWKLDSKKIVFKVKNQAPYTVKCNFSVSIALRGAVETSYRITLKEERSDDTVFASQDQTITFDFTDQYNQIKANAGQDLTLIDADDELNTEDCQLADSPSDDWTSQPVRPSISVNPTLSDNSINMEIESSGCWAGDLCFQNWEHQVDLEPGYYVVETIGNRNLDTKITILTSGRQEISKSDLNRGFGFHEREEVPYLGGGHYIIKTSLTKRSAQNEKFRLMLFKKVEQAGGFYHSTFLELPFCSQFGGGFGDIFSCFGNNQCLKINTNWDSNADEDQWCRR